MKTLFKGFILPLIYIFASLPLPVLYVFSGLMGFFLQHIIRYRHNIVTENLQRSFPEKNKQEISKIRSHYYRYMSDLSIETLKALTISADDIKKRCRLSPEANLLFNKLYNEKKNIVIVLGHWGNWEWGGSAFSLLTKYPLYVLYRPLNNKNMDTFIYKLRTRLGVKLISMNDAYRDILSRKTIISATAFIADQTPPPEGALWINFLNQATAVFRGTARITKKTSYTLVYVGIEREKQGYYHINAEILTENPSDFTEEELTEMHTRRLEKDIIKIPFTWLWSHRRWKHQQQANKP